MEQREIVREVKAFQKSLLNLKKTFEKERKRLDTLDDKAAKKRVALGEKRNQTTDEKKREKLDEQINALPDYEGPLGVLGTTDDDFDESILGVINAMEQEVESLLKKEGLIEQFFSDLEVAESPAED